MSRSASDPGGQVDLLLYSPTDIFNPLKGGAGQFFQTGNLGEINPKDVQLGWRATWSMIIAGKFSASAAAPGGTDDLLFYDPTTGEGEFHHTNNGLGEVFATASGWRTTWSNIVALQS